MACADCFKGGIASGNPRGTIETLYGRSTYVIEPSKARSSSAIIVFTDAFGLNLVNTKLLADAYASATGFRVLVPDIIPGGGMNPDTMYLMDRWQDPVPLWNLWGQLVRIYYLLCALRMSIPFLWRAYPSSSNCFNRCLEYTRKVRVDLPEGAKLGVVGFCWGGYQSINLCSSTATGNDRKPLVDAQFCAHPALLHLPRDIVDAVVRFRTKVAIAHAEMDYSLSTRQLEETEAALRQEAGDVRHGFAVRAKPGSDLEARAADEALDQATSWFMKWL
jgi:dienelactone hydrolase